MNSFATITGAEYVECLFGFALIQMGECNLFGFTLIQMGECNLCVKIFLIFFVKLLLFFL